MEPGPSHSATGPLPRSIPRALARALPRVLLLETGLAVILFASAGRIDLPWVWVMLAVHTAMMTAILSLVDPTLPGERARPGPGAVDGTLRRVLTLLLLGHLVLAGVDVGRFQWSGPTALPVRIAALVVFALGMSLGMWAMVVNRFFSSAVRLQTDRGHHVIDTGPYRFVRHPGYASLLLSATGGAVVIGSWWSLLPLAPMAAVVAWRMVMEDAFLHRELAGYPAYAGRVRHKLVPGLW